jgi:hypothetical protein
VLLEVAAHSRFARFVHLEFLAVASQRGEEGGLLCRLLLRLSSMQIPGSSFSIMPLMLLLQGAEEFGSVVTKKLITDWLDAIASKIKEHINRL